MCPGNVAQPDIALSAAKSPRTRVPPRWRMHCVRAGSLGRVSMEISRRAFIQTTIIGGASLSAFGFDVAPLYAQAKTLKIERTTETRSTCPYCAVSCGVIIHTLGDKAKNAIPQAIHVEGDPDHPINRGTLCPK